MIKNFIFLSGLVLSVASLTTASYASTCQGHPDCEGLNKTAGTAARIIELIEMECTLVYQPTNRFFYATGPKWTAHKRALDACSAYATQQGGSEKDCGKVECAPVE